MATQVFYIYKNTEIIDTLKYCLEIFARQKQRDYLRLIIQEWEHYDKMVYLDLLGLNPSLINQVGQCFMVYSWIPRV